MKNLKIGAKLFVGFGIVLLLMLGTIALSMISINTVSEQVDLYGHYTLPNNNSLWIIRRNTVSAQRYLARAFLETDINAVNKMVESANSDGAAALAELGVFAANQRSHDRDDQIAEVQALFETVCDVRLHIVDLISQNTKSSRDEAYDQFVNEYIPTFDKIVDILVDFSDSAAQHAEQQKLDAQAAKDRAWLIAIICSGVAILFVIVIVIIIRSSILRPIKEIMRVYAEMAKGNMSVQVNYDSRDELGIMAKLIQKANNMQSTILGDVIHKFSLIAQGDMRIKVDMDYPGDFAALKEAMQTTADNLNETLTIINTAAEQVSTGASQVSGGAQLLAVGSTEQAASLEEIGVTITTVAEQAGKNTNNVKLAADYVSQAGNGVIKGYEHMEQLKKAMVNIDSASTQIANITKVIDDIAFQTNILALNAAIEAARAGNAGKGFAVVADEVRNLAAKSAEAAQKTTDLIQHTTATVSEGTKLTDLTATVLSDVKIKAALVSESIIKIEQSSQEQTAAIEQVRKGITEVSAVVQTNAATAEENSATSEEMASQAAALRGEVSKFILSYN